MLKNIKDIYGTKLTATDGEIGHVKDFYFDDKSWAVRYLVVDTGSWLPGRLVLLAPQAFDGFGPITAITTGPSTGRARGCGALADFPSCHRRCYPPTN
jgi:PRC-barrel domain